MAEIYRPPAVRCPTCQAQLDAASIGAGIEAAPEPGDFTICSYCETVLVFGEDYAVRRLTEVERAALPADAEESIQGALQTVRRINAALGRAPRGKAH